MICKKCGCLMQVADKPEGFLHLYGVSCPNCWPEERRRQNAITVWCAVLLLLFILGITFASFHC